eukprot:2357282-Amphidinium_carterae.1
MDTLALLSIGPPGQPAGQDFTSSVLIPLAGTADCEDAIIIKKLYVEAHAQLIRELRLRVDGGKNIQGEKAYEPASALGRWAKGFGLHFLSICWSGVIHQTTIERDVVADISALFDSEAALELLGVAFSKKESKGRSFDETFKLLGVQVNLAARTALSRPAMSLCNTRERLEELRDELCR